MDSMRAELIKHVEERIKNVTENITTYENDFKTLSERATSCRQYLGELKHIRRQLDRLTEHEGK